MPAGITARIAPLMALVIAAATVAVGVVVTAPTVKADVTSPNWGQRSPSQSPPSRAYAAMAYDSRRSRVVLFGGGFADTWEWDGSQWSTFFTVPSPAGSYGPGLAYDSARGVTVLFDQAGHTWEWNGSAWLQRQTASAPAPRAWTSMAYDAAQGVMLLFGGNVLTNQGGISSGDTWAFDGSNWTKLTPAHSPSPRYGMTMAYDSARGVVVLFGGSSLTGRVNDTWEWNGADWVQRTPTTSPYPRFWQAMAYDQTLGETVMFGGDHVEPFGLGPINDTWLWDGNNWTRDWTAGAPVPRAGQTMAYDAATGREVLFGGTDEGFPGTFYGDTWELGSDIVTVPGNPALAVNPTTSIFQARSALGITTAPQNIFVTSAGTGPVVISSITASGDFAVSYDDCPIAPNPLAVGGRCRIQVTFTPQACATETGTLTLADNELSGASIVALQGGVLNSTCDSDLALFPPSDKTVPATSPSGAVVNFGSLAYSDEDGAAAAQTCSPASGSTFPIGTTTVTCQLTDADDATSTVSVTFRITVTDTDLGLAGVPADISVTTTSTSGAVVTYQQPAAVDEDAATPAVTCSPASGSTFALGTTTVTCTASDTDDSPSSVSATFKVTVNDNDLAFSGVPADGSVNATSPAGAVVNYSMPVAVDEDATAPVVTCRPAPGAVFPIGTTAVSCSASDADDTPGSISTSFRITVNDTDLALSGVPASVTVDATTPSGAPVTFNPPTAVDEDGPVAVTCDHAPGSTFPIGTTTVACQAADADDTPGLVASSFSVTVRDTDLGLSGPADITAIATSASGAAVNYPAPVAADEDGASPIVSCDHPSGSTFPVGVMTLVTCTASDVDDSPSSVSIGFFVSVIPDLQLAITTSPTTASAHTTVTTAATVTNIGAASRKTTITYAVTFTDAAGNTTTVAANKAVVTVAAGQSATRSFSFTVRNTTPSGTYTVTVTTSDVTGSVTQTGTFAVS